MVGSENSTIGGPSRAPPWLHHNYPSRCLRVATYHDPFCPFRFAKTDPGSAGCLKSRPIGHRSFGCRGDNCILHSVLNSPTRNDHDHSALVPQRRFSFKTYSEILYRSCERARKVSACHCCACRRLHPDLRSGYHHPTIVHLWEFHECPISDDKDGKHIVSCDRLGSSRANSKRDFSFKMPQHL
jgi:hypothetical protein